MFHKFVKGIYFIKDTSLSVSVVKIREVFETHANFLLSASTIPTAWRRSPTRSD